ncbi:MAG: glycosyltransferase family 2 protein [Verrucomicrobiota bacterium]
MWWIFSSIAALYLFSAGFALFHSRWARRLPALGTLPATPGNGDSPEPRCSVVIAARDEAARIEATVQRVLGQRGIAIELIVVDDRSTDGTGDIVRRLAAADARVQVKRVDTLPDGWLGKCHACHVGASAATGDWILFTDADCWLKPDVVARALRVAGRDGVEHITLTPGVAPETLGAQAWHLAFLLSLTNWLSAVNRDRTGAYLGMGAFNLVRAAAYRECGGYETLRLTVLDDVRLGLLLRRAGKRTRGFIGGDDVECHWGTTVPGMIRIMEKNYFAAVDYRVTAALTCGVGGLLTWGLAVVGPFTGTPAGMAAGGALLSVMVPSGVLARRLGWPWRGAVFTPFVYPALFYAVLNSTFVTLGRGGIRWRDTFYPLKTLRAGNVR